MKFLPILLLSAATSALARGGGNDDDSDSHGGGGGRRWRNSTSPSTSSSNPNAQCKHLARLTSLASLASDPSKLASLDPSKADAVKAKASSAAAQLATLQSNSTLTTTCAPFLAAAEMSHVCAQLSHLERLTSLVANETRLASKTDGNTTEAELLKEQVAASADELAALQGNATLTAFCEGERTRETCRDMKRLQRLVEKGANATTTKFGGDQDKLDKFMAKVEGAKGELEGLMGNATLVGICEELKSSNGGSSDSSSSGSSSSGGQGESTSEDGITASAGILLQPLGTMVVSLATVSLFGLLVL